MLEQRLGICGKVCDNTKRVCMGESMPCIRDARVRHLASCVYNATCAVSPEDLHRMICNEEWERVASLLPPATETTGVREACTDHRVLGSSLHDLCPTVVQSSWCDDVPCRWFRGVYTFDDPRHAHLASRASSHIFCRQRATLEIISDALDDYRTRDLRLHHVSEDWNISTGTWDNIRNATVDSVGYIASLLVISRAHRSAFTCIVASHEWMFVKDDSMVLRHRGRLSVTLRYVRQTFGGVVALEVEESDEWWPPFLVENRMVPPSLFPSLCSSSPCTVSLATDSCGRRKRNSIDVDELTSDRYVRSVIHTWNKSYESRYADAPTLTSIAYMQFVETLTHRGYPAHRVHTSTSQHGIDAECLLKGRFGDVYGRRAMQRILADDVAGLYVVYDTDMVCVSTFAVVMYNTHGGRLACCVDSFAVSANHQGTGVGNVTFHALLRGVCDRASVDGTPYIVFAQCVRTGDARHFWYDKLDESTVARSLLLQALQIDAKRIPVQLSSQCTPRAREYRSSDLEESV